jgi:chromosome partitioning protein
MLVIAVVNLKGGSRKTTTTGFLGAAFHEGGLRVLGVDADGENESLARWQAGADLPWPVIGMAVPNLHKTLPGVAGDRYDVAVIDTPPMKAQRGTVLSAVRLATHVVVPMAPTPVEYDRLEAVKELLADAADLRPDGQPPAHAVLLTGVTTRAASTAFYREQAEMAGWTVLQAEVIHSQRYSQAWGDPIKNASKGPYGAAANELLDLEPQGVTA